MKYLKRIVTILLVLVVAISCRHRSMEQRAEWIVKKVSSELDLNDKQRVELDRIKKEILDKRRELDLKMIPEEIVAQIRLDQVDEAKINSIFEVNDTKRDQMRVFMVKKAIEFHAMLTSEQRNKLADKIGKLLKRHNHD